MKQHQTIHILLIEDNPGDVHLITEMMEDVQDHRLFVVHADCLSEGLKKLSEIRFDIVLLDIGLPDSTGLDSITEIRDAAPDLPIIMLTGVHDEETISSSLLLGAQDYLIKGRIDADILVRAIRYSIERQYAATEIESKQHFIQHLADTTPDILYVFDIMNHALLYCNQALMNVLGYSMDEINRFGAAVYKELAHPDDLSKIVEYTARLSVSREDEIHDLECRVKHHNGRWLWIHFRSTAFSIEKDGSVKEILGIARDITDRKEAELLIMNSLDEKELLLREIHHRVKNNMMIITSLLSLQARNIRNSEYRNAFNESISRIKSMALIHEKLYAAGDMANIKFDDYLDGLLNFIVMSYNVTNRKISLKKDIDAIPLNIGSAIPCGLIVNELITNCLKHAFPGDRAGEIRVTLREVPGSEMPDAGTESKMVELIVCDNGVGIQGTMDIEKADSLGLTMVHTLVKQIHGSIDFLSSQGTEFRIRFRK